jgi:hypothetical protein
MRDGVGPVVQQQVSGPTMEIPMNRLRSMTTAGAALLALAACNPFRSPIKQDPVVEVSAHDVNVNARWNATLASPADLAGAVQMRGSASMTPGSGGSNTRVAVDLANASPGGLHPWQVRAGQCGSDEGVFGSADSYHALKVDDQGHATAEATLPIVMPRDGRYYVSVGASAANASTIVACGNLAAPSR